jgi:thiamine-monophosphate kinase
MSGLMISVTIIGKSTNELTTYRSGAKPNDLLMLTGDLGAAYLGLQILEREKSIFETQDLGQPDLTQYSYVLERQLKPEPRTDVIRLLREKKIKPTSMIDISDGLASELHHISKFSSIGVKVFEERIPIKNTSRLVADELNLNPTSCALNGGEDYELLFTVPLELHDEVQAMRGCVEIGHVTSTGLVEMVTTTNSVVNLPPNSWDSFKHI